MLNWKSVLLTSALIVAPSAYIQAYATTVQPESDWAITKVTAKNPGSAPYCALARRFQNNIIMTIARNTRDETSVAIDFQQPIFNEGESVTLKLSAGNNPSRDFIVPPASKKAVVARIGADRAFFDEIGRAGALDVALMGQQYQFVVPDMSTANTQISTCLVSLGNTQNFASNTNAAPSGVDSKIEALQTQIASLQQERTTIAQQQSNADAYNNQLRSAAGSGGNEDLATKIAELQLQNITLRSKMDEQRAALDNVQSNSLEDKSRLALLEETQDQLRRAEEETKKFRDQLYTTQNKQDNLLTKLEKYSNEETKRKELETHLAGLQHEQAILTEQYAEEKSRLELVQSAQEAVLAQQKEELERTKVQLAQTTQEKTVLTEEKEALQGRLQEYSGIKDKLTALAGEQKELGQTVVILKEEREGLSQKLLSEKARLEQIEKDRVALKEELEQKTTQSESEKAKLQALLDEEKKNRDIVAGLESELQNVQTEQDQLATKLKDLETEKGSLQIRVGTLEVQVKEVEAQREVALTEQKIAIAEKEKATQSLAAEKAEREKVTLTLQQEQQAKAQLQTEFVSEQDKRRDVVARLEKEAARRAEIISQMEAQAIKNEELVKTQQQNKELREQALADAARLKAEKEQLAIDTKELAAKREELAQALNEADTIIDTQMSTIDTLTIKQKGLLSQVTSLETEKKDLLAQLDTHKAQLIEKQSDTRTNRNAEYEVSSIKNELSKMSKERDELRNALAELRNSNAQIAKTNLPANDDMSMLYTQIEELEYQRVDLNSAVEFERELNNVVTASGDNAGLGEMKAALAAMRAERDEFNRLLNAERAKTKKLEAVIGPDGASQTTLAELNGRIKKLESDNVNLLRELEYEKTRKAGAAVTGDPVLANAGVDNSSDMTILRLRNEVKRLSDQSKSLEKEQTGLLSQVRTLEAEKQKIVQSDPISSVPNNVGETEELKKQIALLKEEKDNLGRALVSKQKMAAMQEKQIAAPVPKIEISKVESSLAAQNAYVLEQKETANREVQSLRAQLAQTKALLEAREAQKIAQADTQKGRVNMPVSQPIIDQAQLNSVSPAARNFDVESDVRTILQNASVTPPSEFGPVTIPVASNVQAWRWKSGQYAGNAEAHFAPDADTRNVMINEFLAKAKSRCPGDFAVIENSRTQSASGLVVSSDIACVAGNNGVAAAIAFIQVDDQIIAISHEAPTSSLADAMTTRDEIVRSALTRSQT